jgi:hypothetical protein
MASASSTFSGFAFFTLVYFIIKYFVGKNPNSSKSVMILMAIYIIIVMLMAYGSNVQSIKQMCGEPYFGLALMATIVPWTFIFGILNVALIMMPGWKAPFSNTFGYLLVKMNGIQGVFNDIFKAKMGKITINKASNLDNALEKIYSDKSLLINELTPANFEAFWTNFKPLFKADAGSYKEKLYNMIRMKDLVSEFIWYLLVGLIVTTLSSNYIIGMGCNPSLKSIEKNQDKWSKNQMDKQAKAAEPPKVYIHRD